MRRFLVLLCALALVPLCLFAKVFDCFLFFNEFEVLKIRLAELDPYVDRFVLVENCETQRGHSKPFLFNEHKHLFAQYLPKIIHIMVNERYPGGTVCWEREHFQRNAIARGLTQCEPTDIVMISDLDEIPRGDLILEMQQHLLIERQLGRSEAIGCKMHSFFFQLNRVVNPARETWGGGRWHGTVMTTYERLSQHTPQYFRDRRGDWPAPFEQGGWHFSWMGGLDRIKMKRRSVVEGADDDGDPGTMLNTIAQHQPVKIDASFPWYVRENEEYLKQIGYIAEY